MTDLEDANRFYMRLLSDNSYYKIEELLDDFDPIRADDLERPIKKGTLCAAKYSADDRWYRAKVISSVGKG